MERRARRRRKRTVLRLALLASFVVIVVVSVIALSTSSPTKAPTTTRAAGSKPAPVAVAARPRRTVTVLSEHPTGISPQPVEDAAYTAFGQRASLLGGLTAADLSTDQILSAGPKAGRVIGRLPSVRHDTAAVTIGRFVYLFGGGNGVSQLDEIVRIDPRSGQSTVVGHLPAASSDSSAAAIGGTAYVVGGYTGTQWLDTILAWRPGTAARVVAHLPAPLRYTAVAAAGGRLVIAGGSLESGSASRSVLEFDPQTGKMSRVGTLPAPTTHAAAAALGPDVYVIGGRGALLDSPTARIVSIDPVSKRIRAAGSLRVARSDLAAVPIERRILLAGGHAAAGTVASLSELVPARRDGQDGPGGHTEDGGCVRTRLSEHARPGGPGSTAADLRAEQSEQHG